VGTWDWTSRYIRLYIAIASADELPETSRGCAMIDARIFDRMSVFFDDLVGSVRAEVSLVMVALAGDAYINVDENFDYEEAARSLLDAPTRIHRLGKMITAIAVLDVYFASNPKRRLGALLESYEDLCKRHDDASLRAARDRYVERLEAVESAQRQWSDLRANELTTAASARHSHAMRQVHRALGEPTTSSALHRNTPR
jgi:hypothetical protein